MKNILITGAAGFIGHHIVKHFLDNTDYKIYILDKLSYASFGLDRLREISAVLNSRVTIYTYDLNTKIEEGLAKELKDINWILHLGAETHVDNSIKDPYNCITNNINSTVTLLEFARTLKNLERFLYFSTDEVYGPALNDKLFKETERHNATNPYSASKSASEMLCNSYYHTFKLPLLVCNAMNIFGIRQHQEKFIPKTIRNILIDRENIIHCSENNKSGSRFYIHTSIVAKAVEFIMEKGTIGETYNITGQKELTNEELCDKIGNILNKIPIKKFVANDENRPNHDTRYGLDGKKLKNLGFNIDYDIDKYLIETVNWTKDNYWY